MEHLFGSTHGDPWFTGVIQVTKSCDGLQMGSRVLHATPVIICQPDLPLGRVALYDRRTG